MSVPCVEQQRVSIMWSARTWHFIFMSRCAVVHLLILTNINTISILLGFIDAQLTMECSFHLGSPLNLVQYDSGQRKAFTIKDTRTINYGTRRCTHNTKGDKQEQGNCLFCLWPCLDRDKKMGPKIQEGISNVWKGHRCSYPLRPRRITWIKTKREGVWRADTPAPSNQTGLAWTAKPINAATPGLGTSVCLLPMKHHHVSPLAMPAQPAPGECRLKQICAILRSPTNLL